MKSRSNRPPTSDPPDDWVNGSWTVDCVCGVNFDDGEEMVDCDECGVWVHTRCSRYVKSEKSFSCDKCKSKTSLQNESEETEVAQLLVELPTKTLRMENACYPSSGRRPPPPPPPPSKRPFRLWTDIPMEERVHVQGIPGGDSGFFDNSRSIFGPQLWKTSGYVPKKFNFQYREFPCWDEYQDVDRKSNGEERGNSFDKSANVLFSLSKENLLPTSITNSGFTKTLEDDAICNMLAFSKDVKSGESDHVDVKHLESGSKKDSNLRQPIVFYSGKRKKDGSVFLKDQSDRKKVKTFDEEGDLKKRVSNVSLSVSTLSSDAQKLECYEDVAKVVEADPRCCKRENSADVVRDDLATDGNCVENNRKFNLVSMGEASEALHSDSLWPNASSLSKPDGDNSDTNISALISCSTKMNGGTSVEHINSKNSSIKDEVANDAVHNSSEGGGSTRVIVIGLNKSDPLVSDVAGVTPVAKDRLKVLDSNNHLPLQNSVRLKEEVNLGKKEEVNLGKKEEVNLGKKEEVNLGKSVEVNNFLSSSTTDRKLEATNASCKHPELSVSPAIKSGYINNTEISSPHCIDHKVQDFEGNTVLSEHKIDKDDGLTTYPFEAKSQSAGSESSIAIRRTTFEVKHGTVPSEEAAKSGAMSSGLSASSCIRKLVVSSGKLSSNSTILMSRRSSSDNRRPVDELCHNSTARQKGMPECNFNKKSYSSSNIARDEDRRNRNASIKQKGVTDCKSSSLKENTSTDILRGEEEGEPQKKIRKEIAKSSYSTVLKASHLNKSHDSTIKRSSSDLKGNLVSSSVKASLEEEVTAADCGESVMLPCSENVSSAENKTAGSGLSHRSDKTNQLNCQTSSKTNQSQPVLPSLPSNPPAMLSDEELALLLHQELNSSPRVPRVPRMRQAGSIPQLSSPTSSGMLMRRTSTSGGKDQSLVPRRKNKDGSRNSRDVEDEAKKTNRMPFLFDHKRHESMRAKDTASNETDSASTKGIVSIKKGIVSVLTTTASSGLSSSTDGNEQNLSSTHSSLRNVSDEDAGIAGRANHRTLPGLIAEIMSKGKRMTYEELCNAVLPHWPHLRKHNGERYAYTSHSQAVLDCLRNRNEWSQLVDRGPKTSASRKRRKLDIDPSNFELEDNEFSRDVIGKDREKASIEHREDFPRGKRNARKRGRLALHGIGVKEGRNRRKADVVSDDDMGSYSSSSEESASSEEDDEIEGGEECQDGSEASASSSDTG